MTTNEPRTPDEIIAIVFNQLEPEARGRARGLMEAIAALGAARKEITTAQDYLHARATAAAENAGLTFSQVQGANKFMPTETAIGLFDTIQTHLSRCLLDAAGKELPGGATARAYAFPTDTKEADK